MRCFNFYLLCYKIKKIFATILISIPNRSGIALTFMYFVEMLSVLLWYVSLSQKMVYAIAETVKIIEL